MLSIFPWLDTSFQTRLAQLAILTQRAAVLAALPARVSAKGRPVAWATLPAPELLRQVVHLTANRHSPKLAALLLRTWFRKKPELRAAVHRALDEAGYPVPPLADCTEPSPYTLRVGPSDVLEQDNEMNFHPNGQPVPGTDATADEVTLMANLLGWSVTNCVPEEIPPGEKSLLSVAENYAVVARVQHMVDDLLPSLPPALAASVREGALPAELAAYWPNEGWETVTQTLALLRSSLQEVLNQPISPPDAAVNLDELIDIVALMEREVTGHYICQQHRAASLALLAQADGLTHSQQPDFAPLATLRGHTAALRARFDAEWPDDPTVMPPKWPELWALVQQARAYRPLLHLVAHPDELHQLDETSADYQQLEALTPPGVLNALLLRKLRPGS